MRRDTVRMCPPRRAKKQRPAERVPCSAGFAICSPRGMGDPLDISPRGSWHLRCVPVCTPNDELVVACILAVEFGRATPGSEKTILAPAADDPRRGDRHHQDPCLWRGRSRWANRNAHMAPRDVRARCRVSDGADALLKTAITRLGLSARAYHRILKIARTVADLDGAAGLQPKHVSEAIQYRSLDRRGVG